MNRRNDVEDIRNFISVNGKVLKPSQPRNKPYEKKHCLTKAHCTASHQTILFETKNTHKEVCEPVSAMKLSTGERKKAVECRENRPLLTEYSDIGVRVDSPRDSLESTQFSTVSPTVTEHQSFRGAKRVPLSPTSQPHPFKDQQLEESQPSLSLDYTNNELSMTTVLNVLNCDTEEFIRNL